MPWGGRWRLSLNKSRIKKISRSEEQGDDENENGSDGEANPLAGLLGGYEEDDAAEEVDEKLLESSEEEDESDSPDDPSPIPPTEEDCEWAATMDTNTGKPYYWNKATGKTVWEKPTELIDLDHQKQEYNKMKELVQKKRQEKAQRREQARKAKEERREVRKKLREKLERERKEKEEEEKRKAEKMKSEMANFMNIIDTVSQEQKKKQEEDKKKEEEEEKKKAEEEKRKSEAKKAEGAVKRKTRWRTVTDKTTGRSYYWNKETGETSWVKPEDLKAAESEGDGKKSKRDGPERRRRRKRSRSRSKSPSRRIRKRFTITKNGDPIDPKKETGLLVKSLKAGLRYMMANRWPRLRNIPENVRLRMELEIRMSDYENGEVSASTTCRKLRDLAVRASAFFDGAQPPLVPQPDAPKKIPPVPAPGMSAPTLPVAEAPPLKKPTGAGDSGGNNGVGKSVVDGGESKAKRSSVIESAPKAPSELNAKAPEEKVNSILDEIESLADSYTPVETASSNNMEVEEPAAKLKRKKKKLKSKDKKMVGLVNKWAAVQRDKDQSTEEPSQRRKRQEAKQIEEWKKQQLSTGAAVTNENFIPVGDWKQRLLGASSSP
ncbi:hypothetical protein AAMO2058_001326300 [Amorphochlora amoebiformis]